MSTPPDPAGMRPVGSLVEIVGPKKGPPGITVLFTGPIYGCLIHYRESGSAICLHPKHCPSTFHQLRPRWHGFAPILLRVGTGPEIWEHRVLEVSRLLGHQLDQRALIGEVWHLVRVKDQRDNWPCQGKHLRTIALPADLLPCDHLAEVRRVYHCAELPPHCIDPIGGHQHMPPVRIEVGLDPAQPAAPAAPAPPTQPAAPAKPGGLRQLHDRRAAKANGLVPQLYTPLGPDQSDHNGSH